MSGGVDSSVAAALLLEQGYDVTGMMLRLWSEPGKEAWNRCCTPDSMAMARRVAARLDIPFYVVDAKRVFRETVVQYFLEGYAAGLTPNPCLVCNRQIRWRFLLDHALALGADFLATGHYARTSRDEKGQVRLLRAVDEDKDQSYVLHGLTQEKLRCTLFPLGEYRKAEVRQKAEALGLPVYKRPDSQDLCFLAGEDYRAFLRRHAPEASRPGDIVNRKGELLGRHSGLPNYTIGQRKGLGIRFPAPLYVLDKEAATNTLVVGQAHELGATRLLAGEVNWVSGAMPESTFRAWVKIRYTARATPAEVCLLEGGQQVEVRFDVPQRDITPGQSAVFYVGDEVMGGGVILSSFV